MPCSTHHIKLRHLHNMKKLFNHLCRRSAFKRTRANDRSGYRQYRGASKKTLLPAPGNAKVAGGAGGEQLLTDLRQSLNKRRKHIDAASAAAASSVPPPGGSRRIDFGIAEGIRHDISAATYHQQHLQPGPANPRPSRYHSQPSSQIIVGGYEVPEAVSRNKEAMKLINTLSYALTERLVALRCGGVWDCYDV